MARGMPEHARELTELLQEKEVWKGEVAFFFKDVRTTAGESQTSFASTLGISSPYLNQIEHGKRTPSSETLNKLRSYVEGETSGDTDKDED